MAPGKLNTPRFFKIASPEIRDLGKIQRPFMSQHGLPLPGAFAHPPTQTFGRLAEGAQLLPKTKMVPGAIKLTPSESAKLIKRFNTKRIDIN
jgi:hypothetical protein